MKASLTRSLNERFRLFVEGQGEKSLDKKVLEKLLEKHLGGAILVDPLGSCENVRQVSQALVAVHPEYWFLIDRDGYTDEQVEQSWKDFPQPNKKNILIWRRRELENYFLEPSYLLKMHTSLKAEYCSEEALRKQLEQDAEKRLYLEALHLVLYDVKRNVRSPSFPPNPQRAEEYPCLDAARGYLRHLAAGALQELDQKIHETVQERALLASYEQRVQELLGNETKPTFGKGRWLELMSGKQLLNDLLGCVIQPDSKDFQIRKMEILVELVSFELEDQPEDFQRLIRQLQHKSVTRH